MFSLIFWKALRYNQDSGWSRKMQSGMKAYWRRVVPREQLSWIVSLVLWSKQVACLRQVLEIQLEEINQILKVKSNIQIYLKRLSSFFQNTIAMSALTSTSPDFWSVVQRLFVGDETCTAWENITQKEIEFLDTLSEDHSFNAVFFTYSRPKGFHSVSVSWNLKASQ